MAMTFSVKLGIVHSSPCDSVSYAEFVYFHFRIFNRTLLTKVLHKTSKNVTCKYLITLH